MQQGHNTYSFTVTAEDAAGNTSDSSDALSITIDATAPTFLSAATNSDETQIILTYNERLSSTTAVASAFLVMTGGTKNDVTGVAISDSTVVLSLNTVINEGNTVTVAYTDPSTDNDINAVQDEAGNDVATRSALTVTNISTVLETPAEEEAPAEEENPAEEEVVQETTDPEEEVVPENSAEKVVKETTDPRETVQIVSLEYQALSGEVFSSKVKTSNAFISNVSYNRLDVAPTIANKPATLDIGQTGINFSITLDSNVALDKIAKIATSLAPLLDGLTTTNNDGTIKPLAYFSYSSNNDGTASEETSLTYDPVKKTGARFYDPNSDGTPDTVVLELVDGDYGDKDGEVNGVIVDSSTAATASLTPVFTASTTSALTVSDISDAISPAALSVSVSISSSAETVNQIGYVALYSTESVDLTYELVKDRATIILSNLESTDSSDISSMSTQRDITLINGQKLVFFEIVDTTLESLLSTHSTLEAFGSSFQTLELSDVTNSVDGSTASANNGGNTISLPLIDGISDIDDSISSELGNDPILDFTALAGLNISGTVSIAREADYDSNVGFYKIKNTDGAVIDPNIGDFLIPGDSGYKDAATHVSNLFDGLASLSTADDSTISQTIGPFTATDMLAPYATITTTGETYFSFDEANSDGLTHFRCFGNGTIGLEDIKGLLRTDFFQRINRHN